MSFDIHYRPPGRPTSPRLAPGDTDDAVYELADAGASASVAIGAYSLELRGHCLLELVHACESLLEELATGASAEQDEQVRERFPLPRADAQLHSWIFPCYVSSVPVIVFASAGAETWIYTRTIADSQEKPLVMLEGRDRQEAVHVPTAQLGSQARDFLDRLLADVRAAFPGLAGDRERG
jgi:hypothetical protein